MIFFNFVIVNKFTVNTLNTFIPFVSLSLKPISTGSTLNVCRASSARGGQLKQLMFSNHNNELFKFELKLQ